MQWYVVFKYVFSNMHSENPFCIWAKAAVSSQSKLLLSEVVKKGVIYLLGWSARFFHLSFQIFYPDTKKFISACKPRGRLCNQTQLKRQHGSKELMFFFYSVHGTDFILFCDGKTNLVSENGEYLSPYHLLFHWYQGSWEIYLGNQTSRVINAAFCKFSFFSNFWSQR